jgi:hypothetical protein
MRCETILLSALCLCLAQPAVARDGSGGSPPDQAAVLSVLPRPRPAPIAVPLPLKRPSDVSRPHAPPPAETTADVTPQVTTADAAQDTAQEIAKDREDAHAAAARQRDLGWQTRLDAVSGAQLRVPTTMVPIAEPRREGTRWRSRYGGIQIETFRIRNGLTLAALFEMEKRKPKPRRIERSVLHDDNFIIGGMQGLRLFVMHAYAKSDELRGFTIQFDQALSGIVAPVAAAVADSFTAFPSGATALASKPSAAVSYGSGVVVSSAGHIVTDRRLTDGCQVIVAAGLGPAERIASDRGFSLLRVFGARGLSVAALADTLPPGQATLRRVPEPDAGSGGGKSADGKVKDEPVEIGGGASVQPLPENGHAGGGIFNADGRLAGLLATRETIIASAGGGTAAVPAALLPVGALRAFLDEHQVRPATSPASDARASVVRIICVRQ